MKEINVYLSRAISPLKFISAGKSFSLTLPKNDHNSFILFLGSDGKHKISTGHKKISLDSKKFILLSENKGPTTTESRSSDDPLLWIKFLFEDYEYLEGSSAKSFIELMCFPDKSRKPSENIRRDMFLIPESGILTYSASIEILLSQLISASDSAYNFPKSYMNYNLSMIIMEMMQEYLDNYKQLQSPTLIGDIKQWLINNLESIPTIESIANHFGYSTRYLSTTFKTQTGFTLMEYLHKLKLDYAKKLLVISDTSIQKIAYSLGYRDEKYFMKLFKQVEGITPTQYRNAFYIKNQIPIE